ncbi:MAG TPA: serine hydrolase [Candidatus Eisenbacteria bacterium]|nr:serine hydrolase [Candidatus Eisenbacteria bacterium]
MTLTVKKVALLAAATGVCVGALAVPVGRGVLAKERPHTAERFPAKLDRYITNVVADWKIPGLAIAVVRNDTTLVTKGYGVRELGKPDRVDENTVFDVASLAKSFTATAVGILVDRGVLRWDDPVRRYLPGLVLPNDELTRTATVRDFLSHRTGLDPANMMWALTAVDRTEVLRRMRYLRVRAPLRQRMIYSNIGYTVAGEAAAAAAGTTFEALLRDLVVKPLGLKSTTWSYEQAATMPNVASPHATIDGRQQPIRRETQRGAIAAAGAVQSSASDMARWMRLHLANGVLDGKRFVSEATMRELHSVQMHIVATAAMRASRFVQDSSAAGYAMGWQVMDYHGHPIVWHTGNGDGQIAYMAFLPRERLGVVVLVNTWSAPMVHGALISRIIDSYLGFEDRDWAGEALARVPRMIAEGDSAYRVLIGGKSGGAPPRPLAAYAGRYEEPLFGPVFVRVEPSGLVLQMGEGQNADLEHHHDDTFLVQWRDPLYREHFTVLLRFGSTGDSITDLSVRINRDEFTARKGGGAASNSGGLLWRPSWPRTEMAVVSGDPSSKGPFVFRFRMPGGYWIHPHRHPVDARLRVISGTFLVGMGERLDSTKVEILETGREIRLGAGMAHFEGTRGNTVVEISGDGPWGITFVDPSKDPAIGLRRD